MFVINIVYLIFQMVVFSRPIKNNFTSPLTWHYFFHKCFLNDLYVFEPFLSLPYLVANQVEERVLAGPEYYVQTDITEPPWYYY